MTREAVLEKARKIIRDNVPDMFGEELDESTVLNEKGNVDSMGFILVLTKLEGELGCRIPDSEWDKISTLGDLADLAMKHMPEAAE
ncbi:MAG: acyl carrier protein [Solobacterium sp.]|jgi:acyl carrier protein|nr:acyl carrier protein [Solobacterium sp.]